MKVAGLILGGGAGSRLQPLTAERSKPAVPIAGKYRLVDIPISNCINSGIRNIFLLTQFNSVSLHQHIGAVYRFDQFSGGHVRILAAEQTPDSAGWFQGTADAVRRSMRYFKNENPDLVVILSGDQLYRMDLKEVIDSHVESGADLTISTKPVPRKEAESLGIMQVNDQGRIVRFSEKPGNTELLDELKAPRDDVICRKYLQRLGAWGCPAVIYGDRKTVEGVLSVLQVEQSIGYNAVGIFSDDASGTLGEVPVLGKLRESTEKSGVAIASIAHLREHDLVQFGLFSSS